MSFTRCDECRSDCTERCFAESARSLSVMSQATRTINRRDATLSTDLAAYKRLRKDGLQPPRIDGSAMRERHAESRAQVEGVPA